MIELMVVISIIMVLLGLIVSIAQRAIDSAHQHETQILLTTLDNAITEFAQENPFASRRGKDRVYDASFGAFPPHYDHRQNPGTDPPLEDWRELRLWQRLVGDPFAENADIPGSTVYDSLAYPAHPSARHDEEFNEFQRYDLENCEGLYLYLTHFSPSARTVLGAIRDQYLTNDDRYRPTLPAQSDAVDILSDTSGGAGHSEDLELAELRDPWGNILSYWVYCFQDKDNDGIYADQSVGGDDVLIDPVPVVESAGPDGEFGHLPGQPVDPTDPDAVKAAADNLFSRQPPWK